MGKKETEEQKRLREEADAFKKEEGSRFEAEYLNKREEIFSKSPEEKAKRTGSFELFYWAFTKSKYVPQELQDKAYEIRKEFFTANPYRIYVDSALYKPLFEGIGTALDKYQKNALSIVLEHERTDKRYANHYKMVQSLGKLSYGL